MGLEDSLAHQVEVEVTVVVVGTPLSIHCPMYLAPQLHSSVTAGAS